MRLFNFRLTQLRVEVERAFGRLKGRWHILKSIPLPSEQAAEVVAACKALHNFLQIHNGNDCLEEWTAEIYAEEQQLDDELAAEGAERPLLAFAEDPSVCSATDSAKNATLRRFDSYYKNTPVL